MARFISFSLLAIVVTGNMFVFAQKHYEPVAMCLFVQEEITPQGRSVEKTAMNTAVPTKMNIYNTFNSNYLTLELYGVVKPVPFQLINAEGKQMYAGTIRGTQLIETESWPAGTYYLEFGSERETIYISKQ